jgi:hypothetical protein
LAVDQVPEGKAQNSEQPYLGTGYFFYAGHLTGCLFLSAAACWLYGV